MSPRAHRPSNQQPPGTGAPTAAWRLFIAVPLPPEVQAFVHGLTAELATEGWPVRWVAAEGAHLTLHFLGATPPERAELVRLALPPVVAPHTPFDLRTAGLGVFPSLRRPRVIWLGLHGPGHRLQALHDDLAVALRELGYPIDDQPFHPHITLGRVRDRGTTAFPLRALPDALRPHLADAGGRHLPPHPVPVREIQLIRSHLGRDGARYEPLGRYPLAPKGARA